MLLYNNHVYFQIFFVFNFYQKSYRSVNFIYFSFYYFKYLLMFFKNQVLIILIFCFFIIILNIDFIY
jgi:hypothetical protein